MRSRFSAFVGAVTVSAAVAAGPVDDAPLQLSRDLTPPAPDTAAGENERTLLRLKLRAAQSGIDGTAAVQELIGRLERMDHAVADLQEAVLTAPPTAGLPTPAAIPPAAGVPWLPAGAAGFAALFLGFWLGRRGRRQDADEPRPAPATATITQPMSRGYGRAPQLLSVAAAEEPPPEAPAPAEEEGGSDGELSLELADVMLSMGLSLGAAQALENHIRAHPRETLYHWLKLLDIYRQAGAHAEFDRAVMDLHRHFNVAPPPWQPGEGGGHGLSLENYPHISARIRELWRTRACADYLARLLEDNRGGTRGGFPQQVAEEILFLLAILRT